MGYPTKVQLIKRGKSNQWYIYVPVAVARAMEFQPSETVEWVIEDKGTLTLHRQKVPQPEMKRKRKDKLVMELDVSKYRKRN